jgi:DNA-binding MarR family transcriptional regulator
MPQPKPSRLARALKQTRPFQGPEHEVFLAIQRVASELAQGVGEILRPAGVSGAQYNVLRILRGAGKDGLPCGEVGERLIARDPDMTRLLDRMQRQGLVSRSRAETDRRIVTTRITAKGLELVGQLDAPVSELHRRQLGHLGAARLRELAGLLQSALKDAPRQAAE